MAKASSKPTGVSISRKGSKFTITWTKGEKYTNQELVWSYTTEVRQNNSSSIGMFVQKPIKLNGSVKSRVLTITAEGLRDVNVGVRGKASGKKWSSYGNATISLKAAQKPTLEAVWEGATPNRTKFNWSAEDAQKAPCSKVVYESVLVKNCPEDYKVDDLFIGADRNEIAVSGKKEDTITVDESGLTGSNARIVRMKAVGQTGESAWVYAYHVYAQPYAAKNVVANINYNPRIGYLEGSVSWDQQQNEMQHPIDTMALQYWIGIPSTNMGLPTTGDWDTIDTPVDVVNDTWSGSFGRALVDDECLFLRVMTQHDNVSNSAYSDYVIALKANLATPTIDSVTPSLVSGAQLITVRLTDASHVPDSKVAVMYQNPDDNKIGVYNVVTNGLASFYVKKTDTIGKVGAYAFVGSYTDNHNNLIWGGYSVDAVMKSPEVWQGVAQSPTITVTKFDDTTATVKWNWPWRDATNAEISWSDHIDAWESTDQPNTYVVSNVNAAQWNISDLDAGKIWYFKVRLFYGDGDDIIYGTYSNMESLDLSAAPAIPVLTLSDQILTQDGEAIAAWTYVSNDTTPQNFAQLYRWSVDDDEYVPIENANTKTAQSLTLKASQIGEVGSKTDLVVKVWSESGYESEFSNPVTVTIATPVTCSISSHNLVSETISIDPQTRTGSLITLNGGDDTNVRDVTSLQVTLEPVQDNKYDSVWAGGNGKNKIALFGLATTPVAGSVSATKQTDGSSYLLAGTASGVSDIYILPNGIYNLDEGTWYMFAPTGTGINGSNGNYFYTIWNDNGTTVYRGCGGSSNVSYYTVSEGVTLRGMFIRVADGVNVNNKLVTPMLVKGEEPNTYEPYSNIVPITAPTTSKNVLDLRNAVHNNWNIGGIPNKLKPNTTYKFSVQGTTSYAYRLYLATSGDNPNSNTTALINTYLTKGGTVTFATPASMTEQWLVLAGNLNGAGNIGLDEILPQAEEGIYLSYYRSYGENVQVNQTGKNILKPLRRTGTLSGLSYSINYDGSVTLNGTSTSAVYVNYDWINNDNHPNDITRYIGETLFASITPTLGNRGNLDVTVYNATSYRTGVSNVDTGKTFSYREGDLWGRTYIAILANTTFNNETFYPMICSNSESDKSWEPYTEQTYTTDTEQAVYGGALDVVNGTGKSTLGMQTITASNVSIFDSYDNVEYAMIPKPTDAASRGSTNIYELLSDSYEVSDTYRGGTWNSAENVGYLFYTFATTSWVIGFPSGTTLAEMQTALEGAQICYELATPTDLSLTPQSITLNEGTNYVWSEQGDVTIRTVEGYEDVLALKELPLEVTVTGTGNGVMRVERAQNFDLERPDERNFTGYEGETIVQKLRGNVSDQIIVNRNELVGRFDDTARYRIIANVSDNFGQSATDTLEFIVDWTHQAVTAQGTVQIIDGVAYITPIKPDGALPTDRVDIYRLSADRPELIYEGVEYDETTGTYETIVDPYPTIGDFGGYRLVLVTANGDYICGGADEDNYPSWVGAEFEGSLDTYVTIIDFGDDEVVLEGNLQVSNSFEKSFERVKYLGGTSRGYWLSGAQRSGSGSTALVTLTDMDTIKAMRRLAQYTGMCHIRTPEGSNFHADIQVEDDTSYQVAGKIMDCSLKITGIDPIDTDGVRLEDWEVE